MRRKIPTYCFVVLKDPDVLMDEFIFSRTGEEREGIAFACCKCRLVSGDLASQKCIICGHKRCVAPMISTYGKLMRPKGASVHRFIEKGRSHGSLAGLVSKQVSSRR